ncbi:hypothetical protein [Saccharopolyspora elongata]|uniref:hypothetical protein n=1 Tax=Saccharopolyspora elongata TaxID=2530387 RepID=UPI00140459F7|nr:hypothetical protein [Saccharopolyspora elongata]
MQPELGGRFIGTRTQDAVIGATFGFTQVDQYVAKISATPFRGSRSTAPKILPKIAEIRDGTIQDDHARSTTAYEKAR